MEETKDLVKQFLSKEGLQYYDGKIKGYVAEQIADAKAYADGLVTDEDGSRFDAAGSAAAAEAAAKAYADGLVKDTEGNSRFDAAGSAAQALADAKTEMETRGLKEGQVLGTAAYADTTAFDAAGTAEGFNTAMDDRVKVLEAIDHEKLAADASSAAVAAIVDGASDSFDTLKEVAEWIANNEHADDVATLVTDVANLKAIDHDAYKGADETVLSNAKEYADGVAATALTDAKTYADGVAATALTDAKTYADDEIDEISKVISEAFSTLKETIGANDDFGLDFTETNKLGECSSIMDAIRVLDAESKDADGSYSDLEARVKANEDNKADKSVVDAMYTNDQIDSFVNAKADKSVVDAMYTNDQIDGFVNAKANAADVYTKEEVYTKSEVEAMVITNEDIDALFAVSAE